MGKLTVVVGGISIKATVQGSDTIWVAGEGTSSGGQKVIPLPNFYYDSGLGIPYLHCLGTFQSGDNFPQFGGTGPRAWLIDGNMAGIQSMTFSFWAGCPAPLGSAVEVGRAYVKLTPEGKRASVDGPPGQYNHGSPPGGPFSFVYQRGGAHYDVWLNINDYALFETSVLKTPEDYNQ